MELVSVGFTGLEKRQSLLMMENDLEEFTKHDDLKADVFKRSVSWEDDDIGSIVRNIKVTILHLSSF